MTIANDALDEADETVNLALSEPANATLGTPFGAELTITDDDNPPVVAFKVAAGEKGEKAGTVEIEVVLTPVSGQRVTVDYAVTGGTAEAGNDYSTVSGTLNFAPGATSNTFQLTLLDDVQDEPDETVILTLSNPVNATLGAKDFTLTIKDNDPPASTDFKVYGPVIVKN
ncbi:MAG: hypothetical protein IT329_03505 [Caldilineaceae bacterium]|nr:hypothetical protein [Caldilineaceae bacterium]